MPELFAFWPYDQFPHALGAQVENIDDATVTVQGFGRLRRTDRMVLAPAGVGARLKEEIKALEEERNARIAKLDKEFESRLADAFKNAGVPRPGRP